MATCGGNGTPLEPTSVRPGQGANRFRIRHFTAACGRKSARHEPIAVCPHVGNDAGIDPYTRVVSDVYQDLFGEGSFIGKGIYDVDAFEQVLKERFPRTVS